MKTILFSVLLLLQFPLYAQTPGAFTDSRDGQVYETVTYIINSDATMTWMAQNLNYEIEGSYCRSDSADDCEKYGRLYTWPAAVKACPQGWHLPSDEDWTALVNLYGGLNSAGTHLKSASDLWDHEGKGSNKSLFNAMPYGTGNAESTYPNFGRNAIFWSSNEKDEEYAWDWILATRWEKILRSDGHKFTTGNSVRCVKD